MLIPIIETRVYKKRRCGVYALLLAPNVWLRSSVGRASHRYRRGHGLESRWSPDFFRLLSNCLQLEIYCDDHSSLSSTPTVQIWINSYRLYIISLLTGDMNSINWPSSLPMCGFIAQLVEHRTGIAEVTGSDPVEALIFSGFFFSTAWNWKLTTMIFLPSLPLYFRYCTERWFRMVRNLS